MPGERPTGGPEHHIGGMEQSQVVICDYGAQTADLIYWAVVEAGIRPELIDASRGRTPDYDYIGSKGAVIFSGSKESVNDDNAPRIPADLDIPQFGICYGGQALAKAHGGEVSRLDIGGHDRGEFGQATIEVSPEAVIYGGAKFAKVLMSHHDSITRLPEGFHQTGWSDGIVASFENEAGDIVGTQFHPEVKETDDGREMLRRFLVDSAGIEPDPTYTLEVALNEYMDREEAVVGQMLQNGDEIRGFLSGGIDSVVAAHAICKVARELGRLNQVKFYYVDNGHMREEDEGVVDDMIAQGLPVEKIDARYRYFYTSVEINLKDGSKLQAPPLVDAEDPEIKRAIIGTIFNHISKEIIAEAQAETKGNVYFMQGTNASDIVESREVKSHHNVNAMEELRQAGVLIEPLRHLLKYHIRHLAESRYGLPNEFARRQPFPGVGFSPRIIVNLDGELRPPNADLQVRLDERVANEAGTSITGHLVSMKTVGVKGDQRSVADAVFLDGEPDWQKLEKLAGNIPDFFGSVNRIFYSPGAIRRRNIRGVAVRDNKKFTTELRAMEEIHRQAMLDSGLDEYVSQHFVGTLPIDLNGSGLPMLGLRLFITGDKLTGQSQRRTGSSRETFRTGIAAIPGIHIEEDGFNKLVERLTENLRHHGSLAYDLTTKPPGGTEWE